MSKNVLLEKLQEYLPVARQEILNKERMISFVKQHENCFERFLQSGHITASAWLLNKDETRALLMLHTKLGIWIQLGGHCDGDRDVLGVALKEAQEESGIENIVPVSEKIFDVDIHLIPENSREKEHYHYDVRFLLKVTSDEQILQNRESKALKWFSKHRSKLPTNSPSIIRMFDKWISTRPTLTPRKREGVI